MSRKTRLSSIIFTTWLMIVTAIMLARQTFVIETFFVLALFGLLVIFVLINTATVQPRYLRRIKYLIAIAFLIFGYIIANRIVEVLAL
jgi:hypothetical protein